ncbi:MAG: cell division protein FtsL [Methylococcales symbiont of Hymedesmia sp. n. MRB-2018]|nr:MAG: cell division protein FtsL [Methylococcales symbiont of Hymedesmia sp. n. MRB-2018]KAF3983722.1 MAG: cell division protein FtsL [Methylococcales symbiont of Hymedesmia sp. n. MRB-2018]
MTNFVLLGTLVCLLLVSALLVIDKKYESRSLFIQMQKQEKMLDNFAIEWGQLQLELTMLTEENRVESVAKNKLKLIMPRREKVIYLKQ